MTNRRRYLGCAIAFAVTLAVVAGVLVATRDVGRAAGVATPPTSEQQHIAPAQVSDSTGLFGLPASRRTELIAILGALGIALVGASIFAGPGSPAAAAPQR